MNEQTVLLSYSQPPSGVRSLMDVSDIVKPTFEKGHLIHFPHKRFVFEMPHVCNLHKTMVKCNERAEGLFVFLFVFFFCFFFVSFPNGMSHGNISRQKHQ